MLNKRKFMATIATACLNLNIPRSHVYISHGGASLILGLREVTHDIDISVPQVYWDQLLSLGKLVIYPPLNDRVPELRVIEYMGIDWHLLTTERIDTWNYRQFKVSTRLQLLRDRIHLGRDKDLEDIRLISQYKLHLTTREYMRMSILMAKV